MSLFVANPDFLKNEQHAGFCPAIPASVPSCDIPATADLVSTDTLTRLCHMGYRQQLVHCADETDGHSYEVYRLCDKAGFLGTLQVSTNPDGNQAMVWWLTGNADIYTTRADFFAAYFALHGMEGN